jgi:hypothetical protein
MPMKPMGIPAVIESFVGFLETMVRGARRDVVGQ